MDGGASCLTTADGRDDLLHAVRPTPTPPPPATWFSTFALAFPAPPYHLVLGPRACIREPLDTAAGKSYNNNISNRFSEEETRGGVCNKQYGANGAGHGDLETGRGRAVAGRCKIIAVVVMTYARGVYGFGPGRRHCSSARVGTYLPRVRRRGYRFVVSDSGGAASAEGTNGVKLPGHKTRVLNGVYGGDGGGDKGHNRVNTGTVTVSYIRM